MLYVPIWFVPDEAVRRVCAALVAGRPYLRKIDHTCAKLVISMQGPSYSCQVGHICVGSATLVLGEPYYTRSKKSRIVTAISHEESISSGVRPSAGVCRRGSGGSVLASPFLPDHAGTLAGDCHNSKGVQDMCVVGAINNYTTQLLSYGDASSGCKNSLPHSADDYFFSRLPVVEKRIAQAGVRLASLLNRVFRRTEEEEVLQLVVQSVDEAHAI
ncbi:hypothetical protein GW17_00058702 [Ensete ventricosum]|nr:hypothetical protein GW17_00058702 [Ensete ventricosum]